MSKDRTKRVWQQFLQSSLWLASVGLLLSSSGIDGAYLAKLMPPGWGVLGLVLNTVSDIASEVMMYWYGRLQMDASSTKCPSLCLLAMRGFLAGVSCYRR